MNRVSRREDVLLKSVGLVRMRDLLCLDRWWSTLELAQELGIHERTVQRWLKEMDAIGCMVSETLAAGYRGNAYRYRAEATYGRVVLR